MLILRLPRRRWSLPFVGEEEDDGCGGGAHGCPALGVEEERIDLGWNDLSRIVLPHLGSNLTPYISR